jgi:hypothetical protein
VFNTFFSIYLRIFYSSFPLKKVNTETNSHAWFTSGIRTSCKRKRDFFFFFCRNSSDARLENYYKTKEARKYHFNRLIENSDNKMKTMWDIARLLIGKRKKKY